MGRGELTRGFGLGRSTALTDGNPWGLWIGFDLLVGVALAAGGFVTSAACYIFGLKRYHSAVRPAILTAFLGYALVVFALHYDVGRPWRLPYPFFVSQGVTSVMFEVAICMALYTIVLWMELVPPVLERFGKQKYLDAFNKSLFFIIALGIVLPTMHQSGLGALIIAAGTKISPLWQTPWIGFLFLVSAIVIGFSIVMIEGALTVMGLGRRLELHLYRRLTRVLRWILVFYLLVRFGDLWYRGALGAIATETTARSTMFLIENALFAIPVIVLFHRRWRHSAKLLFLSAACLLLAGAVLRFNGLIVGYTPSAGYVYFPSVIELLVSIGLLAVEAVGFIYIVKRFPVLPPRTHTVAPNARSMPTGLASGQGAG